MALDYVTIYKDGSEYYDINIRSVTLDNNYSASQAKITIEGDINFHYWYQWGVRLKGYISIDGGGWIELCSKADYCDEPYQYVCNNTSGSYLINKTKSTQSVRVSFDSYSETVSGYGGVTNTGYCIYEVPTKVAALPTYTITYNKNGGDTAPSSGTKYHGESYFITSTQPTWNGHTFLKWNTKADGTGTTYSANYEYKTNANLTLYAIWSPAITVYFHPNNGTITESNGIHRYYANTASTSIYEYTISGGYIWSRHSTNGSTTTWNGWDWRKHYTVIDSKVTYADLTNVATYGLSRTGYSIVGTYAFALTSASTTATASIFSQNNTASNSTNPVTTKRLNGGTEITANGTKTLYVNWQINKYNINYTATNASSTPSTQTVTHGGTITLSSTKPTRTNYVFRGWSTTSQTDVSVSASVNYNAGATLTNVTGSKNLYAVWGYAIQYDRNGGSSATPNTQTKIYNTSLTLAAAIAKADTTAARTVNFNYNDAPTGTVTSVTTTATTTYTFASWKATNGTTYSAKGSYTANAYTTLSAQWTTNPTTTAAITLPTPTWTNRSFAGWYTTSTGTTSVGTGGSTYTPVAATTTLYARWKRTITYNANGGSGAPTAQTAFTNTNITITTATPSYADHIFKGWATSSSSTSVNYAAGDNYSNTANTTLYAVWGYKIEYDGNGGINTPATHYQWARQQVRLAEGPTRTGYRFTGWATTSTGTAAYGRGYLYPPTATVTNSKNLKLYATWKEVNTPATLSAVTVGGGNRFVPMNLASKIAEKIVPYFYGDILYDMGTVTWSEYWTSTRLSTPESSDLTIDLTKNGNAAYCYNYDKILVIGRTYHSTNITAIILNPCRNKKFILKDTLMTALSTDTSQRISYMRYAPCSFSADGTKIVVDGTYGQGYLGTTGNAPQINTNFYIRIIKVIGYKLYSTKTI